MFYITSVMFMKNTCLVLKLMVRDVFCWFSIRFLCGSRSPDVETSQ